jgi:hypothetical protein
MTAAAFAAAFAAAAASAAVAAAACLPRLGRTLRGRPTLPTTATATASATATAIATAIAVAIRKEKFLGRIPLQFIVEEDTHPIGPEGMAVALPTRLARLQEFDLARTCFHMLAIHSESSLYFPVAVVLHLWRV